jgi:hypothetical protein
MTGPNPTDPYLAARIEEGRRFEAWRESIIRDLVAAPSRTNHVPASAATLTLGRSWLAAYRERERLRPWRR